MFKGLCRVLGFLGFWGLGGFSGLGLNWVLGLGLPGFGMLGFWGGYRVRVPLKIATVSGFLQGLIIQSNGSRKGVEGFGL